MFFRMMNSSSEQINIFMNPIFFPQAKEGGITRITKVRVRSSLRWDGGRFQNGEMDGEGEHITLSAIVPWPSHIGLTTIHFV